MATCKVDRLLEPEVYRQLRMELAQIARDSANDVMIDLRKLEFIAGAFMSRILECDELLKAKSLRLSLLCNESMAELIRTVGLERLLVAAPD